MTSVSWPPFFGKFLENGGFLTVLTKEVLKTQGHKLEITFQPWARALKMTKRGSYHALLGCWHTKEREQYFIFSKTNVDATPHFLTLPESTLEVKKVEDLHGFKIGLIRGFAVGAQIEEAISANKVQIMEVSFHNNLFKLLQKKRIDLILVKKNIAETQEKAKATATHQPMLLTLASTGMCFA